MPSMWSLDPRLRAIAMRFFDAWHRKHPQLVVTSTVRSWTEQQALYERSLAGQNQGLPAEPPGASLHQYGLAFDMARPTVEPLADPLLDLAGRAWKALGGQWSTRDPVHFAWTPQLGSKRRARRGASRRRRSRT